MSKKEGSNLELGKLNDQKEAWIQQGFIGGAVLCDFLLMKNLGLDIVYNINDSLTQEYISLLKRRLETEQVSLILLASTELEHCLMDSDDQLYNYLGDEIYEHLKSNNGEYPLQAVGLQIDVLHALIILGEDEQAGHYMRILKDTYIQLWGDDSYLFSKNWSYILDEVALNLFPDIAISEFEQYQAVFSANLKNEVILYKLCLDVGNAKTKLQRKVDYRKEAVDLCRMWYKNSSQSLRQIVCPLIEIMAAIYNRDIGEFDAALERLEEADKIADNIHLKLYIQSQIGTILYFKHDLIALNKFFVNNKQVIDGLSEPDENIAEIHNLYGLYLIQQGEYSVAKSEIEKAITISEDVAGKEADTTTKFRSNLLRAKVMMGESIDTELQELLDLVLQNCSGYPESLPLILNFFNYLNSVEIGIGSRGYREAKKVLENKVDLYDTASSIVYKCNMYYSIRENNGDPAVAEKLRSELETFFQRYPNSDGHLQYLQGEFLRCAQESEEEALKILKLIDKHLSELRLGLNSWEFLYKQFIRIRLLLWEQSYAFAKKQLKSFWGEIIIPLFKRLGTRDLLNTEITLKQLRSYASLFISAVNQYPEIGITTKELYEFVLNFKHLYFQFVCAPQNLASLPKHGGWLSINDLTIGRKSLVIECFDYRKYELRNCSTIVGCTAPDPFGTLYQIYFVLHRPSGLFSRFSIEVLWDGRFEALNERLVEAFESDYISKTEQVAWLRLSPLLKNTDNIYICTDIIPLQAPAALLRIDDMRYWGDLCNVIYCNTAKDAGDDIAVRDLSNSVYFGMSKFDGTECGGDQFYEQLPDLIFSELEIGMLGNLTGGQVFLNQKAPKEQSMWKGKSVIHFSTHAVDLNGIGTKALLFNKDEENTYTTLTPEDISEMDWSGVKLVVFSACETGEESWKSARKSSLQLAAKKAGARFSISTCVETQDGVTAFFMVCFYKNLLQYGMICTAFFQTQKTMRTITKREILLDNDYVNIGMEYYLQRFQDNETPFAKNGEWAVYLLQMNEEGVA